MSQVVVYSDPQQMNTTLNTLEGNFICLKAVSYVPITTQELFSKSQNISLKLSFLFPISSRIES